MYKSLGEVNYVFYLNSNAYCIEFNYLKKNLFKVILH